MKEVIEKLTIGESLTLAEAENAMNSIMQGEVNNSQIAAFLIALKAKGETGEEVGGFASSMRANSVKVNSNGSAPIDLCGTGGDNSNTFNISTAAAFAAAGAGVQVAKHGNRSITSSSGSADVLTALGVDNKLSPGESAEALRSIGITFLFAPAYHPAMKYAVPVRKELGIKTVFNILGPLTNPAGTRRQLIGTFSDHTAKIMAEACTYLDMDKVVFVCTDNRYDEITLTGTTKVFEYGGKGMREFSVDNETFGYPKLEINQIAGSSPERNADIINELFETKEKSPAFYVVAANAAMALYSKGFSESIDECRRAAEEAILSGKAGEKLTQLKNYGAA